MSSDAIILCDDCGYPIHPPPPPQRFMLCPNPNCQYRIDLGRRSVEEAGSSVPPVKEQEDADLQRAMQASLQDAHQAVRQAQPLQAQQVVPQAQPPQAGARVQAGGLDRLRDHVLGSIKQTADRFKGAFQDPRKAREREDDVQLAMQQSLQTVSHVDNKFDEELNLAIVRSLQDEEDRKAAANGKKSPRFPTLMTPLNFDWAKDLWNLEKKKEQERQDEELAWQLQEQLNKESASPMQTVGPPTPSPGRLPTPPPGRPQPPSPGARQPQPWEEYVRFGKQRKEKPGLSPPSTPPPASVNPLSFSSILGRPPKEPSSSKPLPSALGETAPLPPPPPKASEPPAKPSSQGDDAAVPASPSQAGGSGDTCTSCGFTPILGPSFVSAVDNDKRFCQSCYNSSKYKATMYEEERAMPGGETPQKAHVYICYGADGDAGVAESMRAHLEGEEIRPGVRIRCFLDRLSADTNSIALTTLRNSRLLLLILSEEALRPLTKGLYQNNTVNKLLLTIEVGLARSKHGKMGILPVLVGSFSKDGAYRPFHGFQSKFATSASASTPSTNPAATMAELSAIQALKMSPYEVLMNLPLILDRLRTLSRPEPSMPSRVDESQLTALVKVAEGGHLAAQCKLALNYCKGENGFPQDFAEGARWFRKAAEQGFPLACNNLGVMYEQGRGVEANPGEAAKWYRVGAEQGDAQCQKSLGVCYLKGHGVPQDVVEAAKWMKKSAGQGDAAGQANLGVLYLTGAGVPRDEGKALDLFHRAALQGNAHGQRALASMLSEGLGVERDPQRAFVLFLSAAEQGDMDAQRSVGACYAGGTGVERSLTKAVEWFRRAANQGDSYAQYNLGLCYESGLGVEINVPEARYWYEKSAAGGCAPARERLKGIGQ